MYEEFLNVQSQSTMCMLTFVDVACVSGHGEGQTESTVPQSERIKCRDIKISSCLQGFRDRNE